MIAIELPPEAEQQLQEAAKNHGANAKEWAEEILLRYLEDLEDIRDAEEAMRNNNPSANISLDEMIRRHGLEN
jgi:predicted DNA-binding protein